MYQYVLLAIATFVIYRLLVRWNRFNATQRQVSDKIPGPPTVPLLGNSSQLKGVGADLTDQICNDWYKTYGSPMKIAFGPFNMVHLFKADHVEALLKCLKNIKKSRDYDFLADWLGYGLLISKGDKWFHRRKMLTPTFHFSILKDFMAVFNRQSKTLIQILRENCKDGKQAMDICNRLSYCSLDIICETAMGKTIQAQRHSENPYVTAIKDFAEEGNYRTMRPWLWPDFVFYYLTPHLGNRWTSLLKTLHGFTNDVIAERLVERQAASTTARKKNSDEDTDEFGKRKRKAFLDMLLDMKDEGQLNLEDIREETDTFMFEGHDTTATGLMWAVYSLARNQEAQNRCREELDEVLGDNEEVSVDDLPKLKYLDMCMKESQRMWPSVPMIVRELDEPLKLDENTTIPPGVEVAMNFLSLHQDPEQFPEPEKFDPDRFLPENTVGRHPFAFVPFSAGLRNCIGQKFAQMESKVVMAYIIRNFRLDCNQKESEMGPAIQLILRPTKGVWVTLTPVKRH